MMHISHGGGSVQLMSFGAGNVSSSVNINSLCTLNITQIAGTDLLHV